MDSAPIDFSSERLVRLAPDRPIVLEPTDRDYIHAALDLLRASFPGQVPTLPPLSAVPARALMRMLVDLRRLRPPVPTPDQRTALGYLAGAIGILNIACAFAVEHDRRHHDGPT